MILYLYCIVCYLIMLGMVMDEYDELSDVDTEMFIPIILSPIFVPIFIGIELNGKTKQEILDKKKEKEDD